MIDKIVELENDNKYLILDSKELDSVIMHYYLIRMIILHKSIYFLRKRKMVMMYIYYLLVINY